MHTLDAWKSLGIEPSVLTTRWNHAWPDQASLRGVPVQRLLPPPTSSWNESHWQRNMAKWLVKNADSFDAIYVDSADSLLWTITTKTASVNKPIVCRFSGDSVRSSKPRSLTSYLPSSVSIRDAMKKCHRVITEHQSGYQALIDLGVGKEQCIWIPDAVFEPAGRTPAHRKMACRALFDVSGDLAIPSQTLLMVHFGETSMSRLQPVLQSACGLLDRGVPIRTWLINPGPDTSKIYEWIKFQGWHHEILIFDGFDVLEDLVCIADLIVVSNPVCSLQYSTRLALESQVPLIAALDPAISEWMPQTPLMKWFYSKDSLAQQLSDWLTHRAQWEAEAMALRRHYHHHYPNEHWMDVWRQVFAMKECFIESTTSQERFQ